MLMIETKKYFETLNKINTKLMGISEGISIGCESEKGIKNNQEFYYIF